MHKRFYGQRQHIIYSLNSLIYQLLTLSFLLSPSIWIYVFRVITQFQYSKPRELDPNATLRFFYGIVLMLNAPVICYHIARGAYEGRVIILDFIGLSYGPSKIQLCFLDIVIVILQLLLTTIAYETSVYYASTDAEPEDPLLPDISPRLSIPLFQQSLEGYSEVASPHLPSSKPSLIPDIPIVVDIHAKPLIAQIRNPPPPPQMSPSIALPADGGAWPLPLPGMRMFIRARRQIRGTTTAQVVEPEGEPPRGRRIPGALDPEPL